MTPATFGEVRSFVAAKDWRRAVLWAQFNADALHYVLASAQRRPDDLTALDQELGALLAWRSAASKAHHTPLCHGATIDAKLAAWREQRHVITRWRIDAPNSKAFESRIERACELTNTTRIHRIMTRGDRHVLFWIATTQPELFVHVTKPRMPWRWTLELAAWRTLTAIVAVDDDGAIGLKGGLPWTPPPGDMALFVRHTPHGRDVIVGSKTAATMPVSFHTRVNVVNPHWHEPARTTCAHPYACVVGGARTYATFAPYIRTWIVTHVPGIHRADTYLPRPFPWEHDDFHVVGHDGPATVYQRGD